jgi:two-component system sensor histidine kinase RegB
MITNQSIKENGNAINLRRLLWLRVIVLLSEVVAISYAITELHIMLSLIPLVLVIGVMTLINLLSLVRLRQPWQVSNLELFSQFILDVLALTIMLFYTGGSTNPFAPLYLLPLTLTAVSLPYIYTWLMVLLTVGCYSILLFYYVPLPEMHGSHDHGFRMHVFGMWLGFLFSAVLIASFLVRMADTVRRQDRKISRLREQQLRQEQILALGTLAAGAAHELGTPLSTMAILLKDQQPGQPVPEKVLDTLRHQLENCKSILASISASSGQVRAVSGSGSRLDVHLQQLIDDWLSSRTEVKAIVKLSGVQPAPLVVADQTLDQALLNIFNNAADASPVDVAISGEWDDDTLMLEVSDRGEGLSPDIADIAGESIHSTKQDGLGLGLFLTYATLERLGGRVQLFNREGGGVLCHVSLPLGTIQIADDHD